MSNQKHIPVLLAEVIDLLQPEDGESYLDLTAGFGGHAVAIKERIGKKGTMTLVDRDIEAINCLKEVFIDYPSVEFLHEDFLTASSQLANSSKKFDVILADLGVSSLHLNNSQRGFSFNKTGPIDMRMDQGQDLSASDLVNSFSVSELADIFKKYGEIHRSQKLAEHIFNSRPYSTTTELSDRINQLLRRKKKVNPSTQVFQALRIAVNSELDLLKKSLPVWTHLLNKGGRIGVISFHSLEDRIVKQYFKDYGTSRYDAKLQLLTKKPVVSGDSEVVFNPRARSAKLRVAQRK